MCQHRFGKGTRSCAQVKHPGWAVTCDLASSPGQSFLVAWDELADGTVISVNLKAKVGADAVAHQLIVSPWFIDAHVQSSFATSIVTPWGCQRGEIMNVFQPCPQD